MRVDRIDQLEKYILTNKSASLDSLCEMFDVSKNTLRRDIDTLVERGNIQKVYGGVVAVEKKQAVELRPFNERSTLHLDLKESIAAKMAKLIQDGDTIFMDTGSSTLPIIDMLDHLSNVTIITNSVPIIYGAISHPSLNVIALPGTLNRSTDSLVGAGCLDSLKNFHLKKAIMSCTGFSPETGVCNASFAEYEIKRAAMSISEEKYLVADHSKYNVTAMMSYARISQFNYLVTDEAPDAALINYCAEAGTQIVF